jgi:hypothetical protein
MKLPLTLIVPPNGEISAQERTLESCLPAATGLQIIALSHHPQLSQFPYADILGGAPPRGLAELINRALPVAKGEFLATAPPGLEISPQLTRWLREEADRREGVNYLYGDYIEADGSNLRQVAANPCPDDITEREDWGPLEMYRTEALREIGGADDSLRFRVDYDLRLKMTEQHPGVHIRKPLCTVPKP